MKKYLQKTYENRFVSIAHNENKKLNSKKSNNSDTRSKTYIRQPGVVVYLRHLKILALASNSSTEESGVQGQPGYIYISTKNLFQKTRGWRYSLPCTTLWVQSPPNLAKEYYE